MSKFICAVMNATSPYNMARIAHNLGMERTSVRILERNFGKQIGRTSESGLRAFQGKWTDGHQHIEVIDKNFRRRAHSVIVQNNDGSWGRVTRFLFRDGKTLETHIQKVKTLVNIGSGPRQDVRYIHYISESGPGMQQRAGKWDITLPNHVKNIQYNKGNILDNII